MAEMRRSVEKAIEELVVAATVEDVEVAVVFWVPHDGSWLIRFAILVDVFELNVARARSAFPCLCLLRLLGLIIVSGLFRVDGSEEEGKQGCKETNWGDVPFFLG